MSKIELAIPCCISCIGLHPDEAMSLIEIKNRIVNPQKLAAAKLMSFEKKRLLLYRNKSCTLCGTTYDNNGNPDESWELTAKRVKMSFDDAGVLGVPDNMVKRTVAKCRKTWLMLLRNRDNLSFSQMEKMTFAGHLAWIITHAQHAREQKQALGVTESLSKLTKISKD